MLKRFILLAFLLAAPAFGALTCTYEPLTGLLLCVPSTSAGSSSVTVAAAAAGDAEVVKQGIGSTINQRGLTAGVGVVLTENTDDIEIEYDSAVIGLKFTSASADPGSTACTTGDYWVREDTDETWDCTDSTPTWTKRAKATHVHSTADTTSGTFADARVAQSNVTQHQAALAIAASQVTSGTLPAARGGTDQTAVTDDSVLVANGTVFQLKAIPDCDNATTSKVLYDTTTNAWSCGTDQSGGASDALTSISLVDEFFSGIVTTGNLGQLQWAFAAGGTNYIPAVANHPGIMQRNTGATINTVATMYLNSTSASGFLPADTFDMTWVLRMNQLTNQTVRVGAHCHSNNISTEVQPTSGMYFEYLSTGSNWFRVTRQASTETNVDTTVAASGSAWIKFRIRRKDASTIGFTVDGGTEADHTANIPTGACGPWFMVTNTAAENKTIDLDFYRLNLTVTR